MTEAHRAVGLAFPPLETRRDVVVDSAVRAEELGYDAFFVAEGWGLDALCLLAEIATKTQRIALGTCVLSVWSRSGATLAMAAATLSQISRSRFILGLGASTPQLVEGFHDVAFASPVDQMRRVVTQVRELLAGNRVPLSRTDQARPLRLGVSAESVPIYLAGLAPASARLSGEIADGWMPTFVPVTRTVFGTPDAARDRLARWYEVGAELPILCLPPNLPPEEIDVALRALAPGSAPDSKPGKAIEP